MNGKGRGVLSTINKNNRGYLISVGQSSHHEKKLEGLKYGHDNSLSEVGYIIKDT